MADISLTNGWHSTDDEVPVPVRVSTTPAEPPAQDRRQPPAPVSIPHRAVNPKTMRLSAFLGIAIVIGIVSAYFGIGADFLSGLTGDLAGQEGTTITVTAAGYFSPDSVTVRPGDTVTLLNTNPDPQVIKSKNGRNLFDVQVLFTDPFTFTVPQSAMGPYVYFSETLPEDRTVNITVMPSDSEPPVTTTDPVEDVIDIPFPFAGGTVEAPAPETPPPPPPAVTVEKTEHSGETAAISIGGEQQTQEPTGSAPLPVNPYTVESGLEKQGRIELIAEQAKQTSELHGGAPLDNFTCDGKGGKGCKGDVGGKGSKGTKGGTKGGTITPPKKMTETGPAGMLALLLPALGSVAYVYRRTIRA